MTTPPDATYERDINVLIRAYKTAILAILTELARLELTDMSRAHSKTALAEVAKVLSSLNDESAEWVKKYIPKAATDGVISAIMGLGAADTVKDAAKIAKFNRLNREFVATAIADTQADLLAVTQNIDRRVLVAVRQATAESMRANLAKGVNGRKTISRDTLTQMRSTLGDSVNTGIIDAAGRRWKPEAYVEMVTRTKMAQTHREATMNEALGRGAMYARISKHGAKDACLFYEGTIVKLVPDAPGSYRYIGDLSRREIFHPRCRHVITPVRDPDGSSPHYARSPSDEPGDQSSQDSGSPGDIRRNPVDGQRISESAERLIRTEEDKIRYLNFEKGMVFDSKGQKLWENTGEERRVNIREARELGILEGNVFTHNHPDSFSFSRADIGLMYLDSIKELRAISPNYLYKMSPGPAIENLNEMAADYQLYYDYLKPQYATKIKRGIINSEKADIEIYNEVVQRLSEKYGFSYSREVL